MRRAVLGGFALLAVAIAATVAGAATLPGGTPINAVITSHTNGQVIPAGPTTITADGSVGIGVAVANTTIVYIVDVSGSTSAGTGGTNCPRQNVYDAPGNTTLDCELLAIRNLNQTAINLHTVADVAMIAFAGNNNGFDDLQGQITSAFALDLDPGSGPQLVINPSQNTYTPPAGTVPAFPASNNLDWVVQSAYLNALPAGFTPGFPFQGLSDGFTLFTPRDVGTSTNYGAALLTLKALLPSIPSPHIQAVMVSDGDPTSGISGLSMAQILTGLTPPSGKTLTIDTFAVGANGTCGLASPDSDGSLEQISLKYGKHCTRLTDPGAAVNAVPGVIASNLNSIGIRVDGALQPVTIPPGPRTGPVTATATTNVNLAVGTHELCAQATGSDGGGNGAAGPNCLTVRAQAPPEITGGGDDPATGFVGTVAEGSAFALTNAVTGAVTTDWSFSGGTGTCVFGDPHAATTSVTCSDNGVYALTLTATDDATPAQVRMLTGHLNVTNVAPEAAMAVGPAVVPLSNATVHAHVAMTDPGSDAWSCTFDWGDGTSTPTGPSSTPACDADHTYTTAGVFHSTVTVGDGDGGTDSDVGTTTVQAPPSLTGLPSDGPGGVPAGVVHEGSAFAIGGTAPAGATLHWSAGAGTGGCTFTSDTSIPTSVTCDDNGLYLLTVTATDSFGQTTPVAFHLQVDNVAPVATMAVGPATVPLSGATVHAHVTLTDPGADAWSCTFDWGDGTSSPAGPSPVRACDADHTYTTAGVFHSTVTVGDGDGGTGHASGTTTVQGAPVLTGLPSDGPGGAPAGSVAEGSPFAIGGTAPGGTTLHWSAAGGTGSCTFTSDTSIPTSVKCTDDGLYTLTVTATDTFGQTTPATFHLQVGNVAPTLLISNPTNGGSSRNVVFNGIATDPGADVLSCSINWGDGSPVETVPAISGFCNATHTYAASLPAATISATASDGDGGVSTIKSVNLTFNRAPICINVHSNLATLWPPNNKMVLVTLSGATDADGDAVTYLITGVRQDEALDGAPDAQLASGGSVWLRAQRAGGGDGRFYTISFTTSDGHGGSCAGTVTVTVAHDQAHSPVKTPGVNVNSLG